MQLSKPPKPKATRKRLKKEILSDDFKKRKIFWTNIAENFPYRKVFYGKFSTSHHYFGGEVNPEVPRRKILRDVKKITSKYQQRYSKAKLIISFSKFLLIDTRCLGW
jgi:hypothetical protein